MLMHIVDAEKRTDCQEPHVLFQFWRRERICGMGAWNAAPYDFCRSSQLWDRRNDLIKPFPSFDIL